MSDSRPPQRGADLGAEILLRAEGLAGPELEELLTDVCAHALAVESDLSAARRQLEERSLLISEPGGLDAWRGALERRRELEQELASVRTVLDELMGGGRFRRAQSGQQEPRPELGSPPRA